MLVDTEDLQLHDAFLRGDVKQSPCLVLTPEQKESDEEPVRTSIFRFKS